MLMTHENQYSILLLQVAEQFIYAVRESSNPPFPMSFFINYDVEDILRQARESTLRYERGNLSLIYLFMIDTTLSILSSHSSRFIVVFSRNSYICSWWSPHCYQGWNRLFSISNYRSPNFCTFLLFFFPFNTHQFCFLSTGILCPYISY